MAAPTFVEASTGATDAGGAWTAGAFVFTAVVGDLYILHVFQDGATSGAVAATSFGNVEALDGTDNSATYLGAFAVGSPTVGYQHIWLCRATNTVGVDAAGTNSTSEDLFWRWLHFSNVSTGTTLAAVIENATAGSTVNSAGTSGTIADASVTTLGLDRLALQFIAISDDNAIASMTGETGGDWTEAVAEYAESSGTDASIGLQIAYPGIYSAGVPSTALVIAGSGGTNEAHAQPFTPGSNVTVSSVSLWLNKLGSPTDNVIVEIRTDSSGEPSSTVVGSATLAASSLSTASAWYNVPLSASLTGSTQYWLVLSRSGSRDLDNCARAYYSLTGPSGEYSTLWSGTWTPNGAGYDIVAIVQTSTGATIDGGTTTNSDATDGWGVVGFALIGTTVAAKSLLRPHRYHLIRR